MRVYETAEQARKQQQSTVTARNVQRFLDGSSEGPFAAHCRQFESALKDLAQQLYGVKVCIALLFITFVESDIAHLKY